MLSMHDAIYTYVKTGKKELAINTGAGFSWQQTRCVAPKLIDFEQQQADNLHQIISTKISSTLALQHPKSNLYTIGDNEEETCVISEYE